MTAQGFFQELQRIISLYPKRPTHVLNSENCDYADNIVFGKNLINCFDCQHCTDSMYLFNSLSAVDCIGGDYNIESQNLYECQGLYKAFNCAYSDDIDQARDVYYSSHLIGCHDLFGCVNLTNKSFCIFNRQYTEQEYREKIKQYLKLPPEQIFKMVDELRLKFPVSNPYSRYNENTTYGTHIYYDKNCYMLFDSSWDENCLYLYDSHHNKSSQDLTTSGQNIELCLECVDCEELFNCNYAVQSSHCQDSSYLINCFDVKDCLGCVNLSHKQYCILNRQYSKEDYERLAPQILEQLKTQNAGWAGLVC